MAWFFADKYDTFMLALWRRDKTITQSLEPKKCDNSGTNPSVKWQGNQKPSRQCNLGWHGQHFVPIKAKSPITPPRYRKRRFAPPLFMVIHRAPCPPILGRVVWWFYVLWTQVLSLRRIWRFGFPLLWHWAWSLFCSKIIQERFHSVIHEAIFLFRLWFVWKKANIYKANKTNKKSSPEIACVSFVMR